MAQVPTGTTFAIGSVLATAKAFTAISNEAEAEVTCASHGYTTGDILLFTSGWARMHLRAFRITVVDTDTYTVDEFDTQSTATFPAGSGTGTTQKVTTWASLSGVMNPQTNGGDPKPVVYKFVDSDIEFTINDGFSATNYTIEQDADQIGSTGYTAMRALTEVQTNTVLRMITKNGAPMYLACTVALNESVRMQEGQINRVIAAFSGTNKLVRYAS